MVASFRQLWTKQSLAGNDQLISIHRGGVGYERLDVPALTDAGIMLFITPDSVRRPMGEVYLTSDPPRMFKAIRNTKRPCLAFKILAAGRLSERRPWVEQAFRETLESIKPSDAVIVGMYDEYDDQPAQNAALAHRYGSARV